MNAERDISSPDSSPSPPSGRGRWPIWIPALAALVGHVSSLKNGFARDDEVLITKNPYVRTLEGLGEMLTSSLFATSGDPLASDYYRPCAALLNWLSWQLFQDGRFGQHAINVALHVGICMLLASIMRRHRIPPVVAAFAASLFAIHPATVEIVAYIGGRQDMMGWLFVLAGWRLLDEAEPLWRCAALAAASTVLATFSRESFLAIVVLLPLATAFRRSGRSELRRGVAAAAGVGAGLGLVTVARLAVGVAWSQPRDPRPLTDWLTTAAAVLLRQLKNTVAPTDLAVDLVPYEPPLPLAIALLLVTTVSLVMTLPAAQTEADHRGLVVFGHLGLLALTAVHTPVALVFGYTSDRYTYPFLLCLALIAAPLFSRAAQSVGEQLGDRPLMPLLRGAPWIFLALVSPLTWARVAIWEDELSLQKQNFIDRPFDPMAKIAEAQRRIQLGDCAGAIPLCQAYLEHFPKTHRADACLGHCYLAVGEPTLAVDHLMSHSKRHPHQVTSRQAALDVLFHLGRLDDVEAMIEAWGPAYANEPDVVAAKRELAHLRGR